jgi:[methyl-Co(III) methanol-specific corrinoid protein]:coenzyme M methyltransferase
LETFCAIPILPKTPISSQKHFAAIFALVLRVHFSAAFGLLFIQVCTGGEMVIYMNELSPKERILRKLKKQTTDRPPVICPGGMMNSAIVEIMNKTGHQLPDGHHDHKIMTELAKDIHEYTGFENFGIPFCLTLEAEVLGSEINYGTLACEPKIQKEVFASVTDVQFKELGAMKKNSRVNSVLESIHTLQGANSDVPVIGSITGPVSAAASIVDPIPFFK